MHYKLGIFLSLWGLISLFSLAKGNEASERNEYLNGGYYLLHHLCEDESNLPLLLVVKTAPKDIETFTDKISKTAKESTAILDRFQDGDSHLKFDQNPLPPVERDIRASIKDDKQHQLLFGATGSEFVRALLVSQIESSTYAIHISKVLADHEKDPDRIKSLQRISTKWSIVRQEAYRLLRDQ